MRSGDYYMIRDNLKCNCGVAHTTKQEIRSAGDVMREGWGVALSFDGKMIKLCPECYKEVKQLANKIIDITGNKYISLSNL